MLEWRSSRHGAAGQSAFDEPCPACRAQNLEPQCFQLTKGDGRLLLPEQDGGGMGASVVWMGDRGLFQI